MRNGKLLSRTLYDELNKILSDESALFAKVEGTNASIVRESMLSEIYSVESSSLICEPCGARYQNEGRKKLETFNVSFSLFVFRSLCSIESKLLLICAIIVNWYEHLIGINLTL